MQNKVIRANAYSIEEIRRFGIHQDVIQTIRFDVFQVCDQDPEQGDWTREDWKNWEETWVAVYKNISTFIREVKKEQILSLLNELSKLANTMLNARYVMRKVKRRMIEIYKAQEAAAQI